MHADPMAGADADGADLTGAAFYLCIEPYAGCPFEAFALDIVCEKGLDDGFFEFVDVFAGAFDEIAEVEDGVADYLTGTVVGDVAATVGFDEGGMFGGELEHVDEEVFFFAGFAEGEDVGVLTKQEIVFCFDLIVKRQVVVLLLDFNDFVEEGLLVLPGGVVFNGSDISEFYFVHWRLYFQLLRPYRACVV